MMSIERLFQKLSIHILVTSKLGYINHVEHSGRKTGDNTEFSCSVPAAAVTA